MLNLLSTDNPTANVYKAISTAYKMNSVYLNNSQLTWGSSELKVVVQPAANVNQVVRF